MSILNGPWSSYTFFENDFSSKDSYYYYRYQLITWKVATIISTYMHLAANSIIFIDLYLTLKNPFYPREKRVSKYNIFLLVVFIFSAINILYSIGNKGTNLNLYDKSRQTIAISIFGLYTLVLFLFTVVPTLLVIFKLCRKGTSKKLRAKVIRRHLIFFSIYILSILAVFEDQNDTITNLINLYLPVCDEEDRTCKNNNSAHTKSLIDPLIMMWNCLGILLAMIRLSEPYVWNHFKQDIKYLFNRESNTHK